MKSKWSVLINGVFVGLELYFFFNLDNLPVYACMGSVVLGELIAMTVGQILFMILMRNKGFMRFIGANRHLDAKF